MNLLDTDRARLPASPAASRRTHKACINCARIKCKCMLRQDGAAGCERCHRLNKKCEPGVAVGPRTRKQTRVSIDPGTRTASRSARLEAKLSDLVDLLKKSDRAGSLQAVEVLKGRGQDDSPVSEAEAEAESANTDPDPDPEVGNYHASAHRARTTATATATPSDNATGADDTGMLPHEADQCLRRFRQDMLPLMPLMHIPPDTSARRFRQEHPFSWLCIAAAASRHPQKCIRAAAAAAARRAIIDEVVEGGQRTLDHLLGMLIFVTWVQLSHKDGLHRNFCTLVAQMAVTVAWDLGLPVPPLLEPSARAQRFVPVVPVPGTPATLLTAHHTMEERRAVLGVYLVTTVSAHMFRTGDGLRWSPYLDYCLAYVAEHSAEPQDAVLVRHVKMQLLVNHVRYAASIESWGDAIASTTNTSTNTHALRAQLDEIAGGGPNFDISDRPDSLDFATHGLYHFAVLAIHESVLARPAALESHESHESQAKQAYSAFAFRPYEPSWLLPDANTSRIAAYARCLASVKAWMDRFLAWPLPLFLCVPCGMYFQLFYVLVCLQKLSVIQDPAWDTEAVRAAVDLFPTMDRIIDMCGQIRAQHGAPASDADAEHDPLLISMRKFTTLKQVWLSEAATCEQERDRQRQRQRQRNASGQSCEGGAGVSASSGSSGSSGLGLQASLGSGMGSHSYGPAPAVTGQNQDNQDNQDSQGNQDNQQSTLLNPALSPIPISHSVDTFSYFHAIPDLMSDTFWF